jgi:hypothetical protein
LELAAPASSAELGGTVVGAVSPFYKPLPFTASAAPGSTVEPRVVPAPEAPPEATVVFTASPTQAALPFAIAETTAPPVTVSDGAIQRATGKLTLARHASLTAELAVAAGNAAAACLRYGIAAEAEWEALDRAWRERLQRNPAEKAEWENLYAVFHTHWRNNAQRKNLPPR